MTNEELVVLIQNGKTEYLKELYEQNKGLIHIIMDEYKYLRLDKEDIESICKIEMWKATQKFDPKHNTKFSTLATQYMRRGLNREIVKEKSQKRSCNLVSLNNVSSFKDGGDENTFLDLMIDESVESEFEKAVKKVSLENLWGRISEKSTENEKKIFVMFYIQEKDQKEIVRKLGLTRQYVYQVCKRLSDKLNMLYFDENQTKTA